jgi:hypothetical protein
VSIEACHHYKMKYSQRKAKNEGKKSKQLKDADDAEIEKKRLRIEN